MSVLIKRGQIVTATETSFSDLFISDGVIRTIGADLDQRADTVIDAYGKLVIPGGIDVHTHLDAPVGGTVSSDDFESGTRAAAFGGTTSIIDFATQSRGHALSEAFAQWRDKARKATIDYGLHMIVLDLSDGREEEIDELIQEGVTSFKLFMAYPGSLMSDDATIYRAMRRAGRQGGLICVHAENGTVIDVLVREALAQGHTAPVYHALTRPPLTESEAVHRAISLARMAEAPLYVVHVSTKEALREIALGRAAGAPVYGETCPHYLLLTTDDLARPGSEGAKYVLTPPLRERSHHEPLWKGLEANDLQVVSTDHCPFNYRSQKLAGMADFTKIPNGGPGVEHRLQLTYHFGVNERKMSPSRWVELNSTNPAKLFGLYPRKGDIRVGADADVVVWNPAASHEISASTHHMRVDYSMFEGFKMKGNAETVLSRGEIIVDHGKWLGRAGRGLFLRRSRFTGA